MRHLEQRPQRPMGSASRSHPARLPPGAQCVANDGDAAALTTFLNAIRMAQVLTRNAVRSTDASTFDTQVLVEKIVSALDTSRAHLVAG